MKRIWIPILLVAVASAIAQTPPAQTPKSQETKTKSNPDHVSVKTVNAVWNKIDVAFAKAGKVKPQTTLTLTGNVAQRNQVIGQLYKSFQHYKPTFRCTPRPFRIIQQYLDMNKDATVKKQLTEMVKWGFIAPAGPFVTGPQTLSPEEFGDGLAYFYLQMKRLSYQPDPQWTAAISPS